MAKREKQKSPAYQWYPKDILSSKRVSMMTLQEEGAYRRALDYCWLHGDLPADVKALAKLIGKNCPVRVAQVVRSMFLVEGGALRHDRLDAERAKQKEFGAKQKKNAEKRWGNTESADSNEDVKTEADATAMPPHTSGISSGTTLADGAHQTGISQTDALQSPVSILHNNTLSLSSATDVNKTILGHEEVVKQTAGNNEFIAAAADYLRCDAAALIGFITTRLAEMNLTGESSKYPLGTIKKILLRDFTEQQNKKQQNTKKENHEKGSRTIGRVSEQELSDFLSRG